MILRRNLESSVPVLIVLGCCVMSGTASAQPAGAEVSTTGIFVSGESQSGYWSGINTNQVVWGLPWCVNMTSWPYCNFCLTRPYIRLGGINNKTVDLVKVGNVYRSPDMVLASLYYFNGVYQGSSTVLHTWFSANIDVGVVLDGRTFHETYPFQVRTIETPGTVYVDAWCTPSVTNPDDIALQAYPVNLPLGGDGLTYAAQLLVTGFTSYGTTVPELASAGFDLKGYIIVAPVGPLFGFQPYWQCDSTHGELFINPICGTLTICDAGCTLTSLAMAANFYSTNLGYGGISVTQMQNSLNKRTWSPPLIDCSDPDYKNSVKLLAASELWRFSDGSILTTERDKNFTLVDIGRVAAVGWPVMLLVPSLNRHTPVEIQQGQGHYIVAHGVRPGAMPDQQGNYKAEDILVAPVDHFHNTFPSDKVTLADYFTEASKKTNMKFDVRKWFNEGVFTTQQGEKVTLSDGTKEKRVTKFRFSGGPVVLAKSPIDIIVEDLYSGCRYFSSSELAARYYDESDDGIVLRVLHDPFFASPVPVDGTESREELIAIGRAYLNDPRYYDFAGRQDFFDPQTDVVLERFDAVDPSPTLERREPADEPPAYPPYVVVLPQMLYGLDVEVQYVSKDQGPFEIIYVSRSPLYIADQTLSGFVGTPQPYSTGEVAGVFHMVPRPEPVNLPPDCGGNLTGYTVLWPPDNKLQAIDVAAAAQVIEPDGDPITIEITSITQDEPVAKQDDGPFEPDGGGIGTGTAWLRAEREGGGNGRVYCVSYTALDDHGNSCEGTLWVHVPHDQSGSSSIDDGQVFDSTQTVAPHEKVEMEQSIEAQQLEPEDVGQVIGY